MSRIVGRIRRTEQGQTMAEYAVVLSIISVSLIITISLLSERVAAMIADVISRM